MFKNGSQKLVEQIEGTELLLKRGIMVNLKNKKGETALDIGRKLNRTQLVNLIEQYKK